MTTENDIKIFRLHESERQFFEQLDPFEKLRLLEHPYGFALGAVVEDEESAFPAALCCGTLSDEKAAIEWLVVRPEYQLQGIGDSMLDLVFRIARSAGVENVAAIILPEYTKEKYLKNAKQYFVDQLFTVENNIGGDMDLFLSDLSRSQFMRGRQTGYDNISSFSALKNTDRVSFLKQLSYFENATYDFPMEGFMEDIDWDISMIGTTKGKIDCALLVSNSMDELFPVYHYSRSGERSDEVIAASIRAAAAKYSPNQNVHITMRQEETKALVKKVTGRFTGAQMLLSNVNAAL